MDEMPVIVSEKHFARVTALVGDRQLWSAENLTKKRASLRPRCWAVFRRTAPSCRRRSSGRSCPCWNSAGWTKPLISSAAGKKPLALYLFTSDQAAERRVLDTCSFGGGCINDTIIHLATTHMPFGGVGSSGMGSYHGKKSFDTFTHTRSIVKKSTWLDLPMRYHPYSEKKLGIIKRFMK